MDQDFVIIDMDELSLVNHLQHHDMGDDSYDNAGMADGDGDDDKASETSSVETVSIFFGIPAKWQCLLFWTSFLSFSTLAICLYSTGYTVPGTILLSFSVLLGLGVLVKYGCGIWIGKMRKNMYYQRRQGILNWLMRFGHQF